MVQARQTSAPRHAGPVADPAAGPAAGVGGAGSTLRTAPPRRRGPVRTAGSLLATVLTVAGLLGFLVLGVGPHTGAYRTVSMLTGSMQPLYPVGAVLIITPQPIAELAPAQVVTFRAPVAGHPVVTHRVVSVDWSGRQPVILTKGDANPGNDAWTVTMTGPTYWQVRGAIPVLGTVLRALRTPVVSAVMTKALPVVLLVGLLTALWRPRRPVG